MTDRELLELAAKAISLPECGWMGPAFMYVKDNRFTDWNPLTDDGDALRLAVLLKFMVDVDGVFCTTVTHGAEDFCELHMGDQYAATRRAIVRAASEIGKSIT